MATGTGPLADVGGQSVGPVANITPSYPILSTADDWARIGETFDRFSAAARPVLNQAAETKGQQEGAAAAQNPQPNQHAPMGFGEEAAYRARGYQAGYLANIRTDIDTRDDQLRLQYQYDPDGYADASSKAASTFIQTAPPEMAVDVENYARAQFAKGHSNIAFATQEKQTQAAFTSLKTRVEVAKQRVLGVASMDHGLESPDYQQALAEYHGAWAELTGNPAFAVPKEQAQQDESNLLDGVQTAQIVREGVGISTQAGGGYAGQAAALRFLRKELLGLDTPTTPPASAGPASLTGDATPVVSAEDAARLPAIDWTKPGDTLAALLGGPVTVTSGKRTAAQQEALIARGLTTTPPGRDEHVAGTAVDFKPPEGMSNLAAIEQLARSGVPFNQIIDEGSHVHIGWGGNQKGQILQGNAHAGYHALQLASDQPPAAPGAQAPTAAPETPAPTSSDFAFSDISPERRDRLYRQATQELGDYWKADNEQQQAARQADEQATRDQREAAGEWRLKVELGEATEADVRAATDINDAAKSSLIAGVRAAGRRQEADDRRDEIQARMDQRQSYLEFADRARANTLSDGDIADGVNAGLIKPGEAQTLRGLRRAAVKPLFDDIMAPVRDYAKRPGMTLRGTAVPMANAEAAAMMYVEQNPQASQQLEQRLKAGEAIAERVFGAHKTGPGRPSASGAVASQSQGLQALETERASRASGGTPMSVSEYNMRRNGIIHGQ